ncbi:putative phage abortive infection protein [Candidatus Albibeggiatoa sp. nov. NOAA]|uniref:putative phage abortive infection protein n=1 Tax=Candidatus Albibeggiatoa sp. nov. NOAA TaxID=3162724 RepID=UPI0032FB2748|nr:putative phage abortive infection protein [Thiotrichaceae bacterium]
MKFIKENHILFIAVAAVIFVASPAILYFLVGVDILGFVGHKDTEIGQWGTVGDYFGGMLNPILAFLSLYLLLQTIRIQSRELEASRQELELSRKEFAKSASALEAQEQQMALQTFENTFFQLLSLYRENVQNMHTNRSSKEISGRECFSNFHRNYKNNYATKKDLLYSYQKSIKGEKIDRIELNVYFKNFSQILRFIDNSKVSYKQCKQYTQLIKAQLSNYELVLIFYNAYYLANSEKKPQFKNLIEKYTFFEDFPEELLLDPEHKKLYAPSAYSDQEEVSS